MFLAISIHFDPFYVDSLSPIDRKFYVEAMIQKNKRKRKINTSIYVV